MAKSKNLAKQIKELEDPIPQDFDPEDDKPAQESDSESGDESDDGLAGTEHYVQVGKSKLRKPEEVALGPQYAGSRVTREQLMNGDDEDESNSVYESADEEAKFEGMEFNGEFDDVEVDSDEALAESDEEKFKDFVFRGSGKPKKPVDAKKPSDVNGVKKRPTAADFMSDSGEEEGVRLSEDDDDEDDLEDEEGDQTDEDVLDVDAQHAEAMEEDSDEENDDSENPDQSDEEEVGSDEESEEEASGDDENDEDEQARRAELRKIMGEEQKTVVATISQAAKADAEKGNAVKQQRKAFDSLLNVRIRLQKALVATNSLAAADDKDQEDGENPFQAAEEAALKLWNTIDGLRHDLSKAASTSKTGQKRKRGIESATSSSAIWERMQASEIANIDNRQTVLEKWSSKVRATTALPISRKLNPNAPQQSITSLLQDTLSSSEHLISRTKVPRSCAPVQKQMKLTTDPNIYDDADFYQLLLKELLDQRMVDSSSAAAGEAGKPMQWTAVKEAKTRKNVDTKASKGRKMKFTVHEKLQNFMAPEDRNTWEESARDRFFATLLGRKLDLGEGGDEEDVSDDGVNNEEAGLMLFRS
ncbi:putative transcription factor aatf che-1 protein [Botrytis fragariae]|uniref:Protein BFR2 n=1 Tax=Botrytis fragariae TaxID=1964551 RepID=A0A8H6AQB6_9HELO|nr:putative transcription factor aatf che-1 protein [Botrytis fragariae]KAF5871534.1 putative transcription factor aatf che-1 protein [Botrytis fragariae]